MADLHSEHERWLAETHFRCCVFVHNYPRHIKVRAAYLSSCPGPVALLLLLQPFDVVASVCLT